jgi:hypothetical protein
MLRAARRWVLTTLLILVCLVAGCTLNSLSVWDAERFLDFVSTRNDIIVSPGIGLIQDADRTKSRIHYPQLRAYFTWRVS